MKIMNFNSMEAGSVSPQALETQQEANGQISIGESTRAVTDWTWSKTGQSVVNAVKYVATQIFELGSWVKNALMSLVSIDIPMDNTELDLPELSPKRATQSDAVKETESTVVDTVFEVAESSQETKSADKAIGVREVSTQSSNTQAVVDSDDEVASRSACCCSRRNSRVVTLFRNLFYSA